MNGNEVLRVVDALHRDKNIDKEIVFEGIEQAILSAARKHFGEDYELEVRVDREHGEPTIKCNGQDLDPDELGDILGRVSAQTAKQVMIQKLREAERDSVFDEFEEQKGELVGGSIIRFEGGAAIVGLGKIEAVLPRSEQIPGESYRTNDRVRAVVLEVRKVGSRVKVILSRKHPELVLRLFESEIPEVSERIIEVRSLAREAGYRSKVAVSCIDNKIDPVGACVGVRGARIRTIVDELAGERVDIVRWNDSLQVLVPNSMQPAEVEDVILCPMLGRVIVLVRDDQLSLAIGKRGQNVRLASKLVGWDIEVMTQNELDEQLEKSVMAFSAIPGVAADLAENLVSQGFFSFYDLSVIEPDELAELGGLTAEQCDIIVDYADIEAERLEQEEEKRKSQESQLRAIEREQAAAAMAAATPAISEEESVDSEEESVVAEEESVVAEEDVSVDAPAEAECETDDNSASADVDGVAVESSAEDPAATEELGDPQAVESSEAAEASSEELAESARAESES
ncbi:MAG: transcription termination factor NusA [Planctomycetota bacterium]|nr:transcription termination factor NusA [Planctomycetota bacterium]